MNFLDKTFGRLGNRMFQMAYVYAQFRDGNIPDFYLQDPKWFEKYGDEIKALFKQQGKLLDYVAIHVRRGDYVNNPFYVDLTKTTYYQDAMDRFSGVTFMIFSDDINWCKTQSIFDRNDVGFSCGYTELEDFNAMTRCKHQIVANSSFSWWAAYLNPNPNKKVIVPKAWYADGVQRTICPKEWIRI